MERKATGKLDKDGNGLICAIEVALMREANALQP
jgi:hypothetical protein